MPEVIVRKGEPVDRALKRLKSKLDAEGILDECDACERLKRRRKRVGAKPKLMRSAAGQSFALIPKMGG